MDAGTLPERLRSVRRPLSEDADLDPLMERIGDAKFVLLGEASHGTSEYYTWRIRISKRLITEKSFSFIAVEGDWPACYQLNRYVRGYEQELGIREVLTTSFRRWPTWIWANWEIVRLAEWLRQHNAERDDRLRVGFYGLDVYGLWESLAEVMRYLERNDSEALEAAYAAYRCFEPHEGDEREYAQAAAFVPTACENEVVSLLAALQRHVDEYPSDRDARFSAERNADAMAGAERYYRTLLKGGPASWNVHDRHMARTLEHLAAHHAELPQGGRAIVWEHNTHVGDARATDMASANMVNLGQLLRDAHADDGVVLVGFGSSHGTVLAGERWGAPARTMSLPRGKPGSWESLFAASGGGDALLITDELTGREARRSRGHRAVGVIYDPNHEWGNYVPTLLPDRYDAFLYTHETSALHPLRLGGVGVGAAERPPDGYPWGV